jgi:hypothetical protein
VVLALGRVRRSIVRTVVAYTTAPIAVAGLPDFLRAQLVFRGVEQGGPSFEARVFLNNPLADERTACTSEAGYAGSFHVYGFGKPLPPALARAAAATTAAPVAPIEKRLRPDASVLRAALTGAAELTVTVVAVPAERGGAAPAKPFEQVEIIT